MGVVTGNAGRAVIFKSSVLENLDRWWCFLKSGRVRLCQEQTPLYPRRQREGRGTPSPSVGAVQGPEKRQSPVGTEKGALRTGAPSWAATLREDWAPAGETPMAPFC